MSQSSVIGAGTVVRGSLEGEGALEIFGRVEGDVIMSGDVAIGAGGAVLGNVTGATLSVQGAVKGDLHGSQAVLLERGARVVGDLTAPRIGIAAGALVRGNVRTEAEPAGGNKRAPAAAPYKPSAFAPKPVAKAEPKLVPPPPPAPETAEGTDEEDEEDDDVTPVPGRPREAERRPPPPVLPSLGKGAKAKKKKGRDD